MKKTKCPPVGKCVHCLNDNIPRNWDHVFPKSWYPDTTPSNMEKWKVPSCYKCNAEYGVLEQDMLMRLACCVDPNTAASSGIYRKVLRSMDARYAPNLKEAHIRIARRNKLLAQLLHGDQIPQEGIYPGLGERWNRSKDAQVAITYALEDTDSVPIKELLDRFGTEYARGSGILVNRAVMPDDGVTAFISIEVWSFRPGH